jgi:hypothetical protein
VRKIPQGELSIDPVADEQLLRNGRGNLGVRHAGEQAGQSQLPTIGRLQANEQDTEIIFIGGGQVIVRERPENLTKRS